MLFDTHILQSCSGVSWFIQTIRITRLLYCWFIIRTIRITRPYPLGDSLSEYVRLTRPQHIEINLKYVLKFLKMKKIQPEIFEVVDFKWLRHMALLASVYYFQSRLKTFGGPRQNINEGPHKTIFLVCFYIPLGIE